MESLNGRVIVITGAASGIGRALSLHAAELGMKLVLADKDLASTELLQGELRARGVDALAVETDVSSAAAVNALCDAAYAKFGKVHVLVNNAGIGTADAAWATPLEAWHRVIDVNLFGVVHGVEAFVPRMLEQGEPAHVVNVASAAGLITVPGLAAYCASKFGVVALSEALHHDLRARAADVHVTLVCPSWVKTNLDGAGQEPCSDDVSRAFRDKVNAAIAHGMPADEVAIETFRAVRAKRFYVLTHADTRAAVHVRAQDILEAREPSLLMR